MEEKLKQLFITYYKDNPFTEEEYLDLFSQISDEDLKSSAVAKSIRKCSQKFGLPVFTIDMIVKFLMNDETSASIKELALAVYIFLAKDPQKNKEDLQLLQSILKESKTQLFFEENFGIIEEHKPIETEIKMVKKSLWDTKVQHQSNIRVSVTKNLRNSFSSTHGPTEREDARGIKKGRGDSLATIQTSQTKEPRLKVGIRNGKIGASGWTHYRRVVNLFTKCDATDIANVAQLNERIHNVSEESALSSASLSFIAELFCFRRGNSPLPLGAVMKERIVSFFSLNKPFIRFLIYRMISGIFYRISSYQYFNESLIKLLLDVVSMTEGELIFVIFGSTVPQEIGEKIKDDVVARDQFSKEMDFIKSIHGEMYQAFQEQSRRIREVTYYCNTKKFMDSLKSQIRLIKNNCAGAIYYSLQLHPRLLCREIFEIIERCARNASEDSSIMIKIITSKSIDEPKDQTTHSTTILSSLEKLEEHRGDTSEFVKYLKTQLRNGRQDLPVFGEKELLKVIKSLSKSEVHVELFQIYIETLDTLQLNDVLFENLLEQLLDAELEKRRPQLLRLLIEIAAKQKLPRFVLDKLCEKSEHLGKDFNSVIWMMKNEKWCCSSKWYSILAKRLVNDETIPEAYEYIEDSENADYEIMCRVGYCCSVILVTASEEEKRKIEQKEAEGKEETKEEEKKELENEEEKEKEEKNNFDDGTIDLMLAAMEEVDDQTKIKLSRAFDNVSSYQTLTSPQILKIQKFIEDPIYQVSILVKHTISNTLRNMSFSHRGIRIDLLNKLLVKENFSTEKMELADKINGNLLIILQNEVAKHYKLEEIFEVLNFFLERKQGMESECLTIIKKYTSKQDALIPESTIKLLEVVFDSQNLFCTIYGDIWEQLINNGQKIPEKILLGICQQGLTKADPEIRNRAFNMLEKANDNYPLPENLFILLEMERGSCQLRVCKDNARRILDILNYFLNYCENLRDGDSVISPSVTNSLEDLLETQDNAEICEKLYVLFRKLAQTSLFNPSTRLLDLLTKNLSKVNQRSHVLELLNLFIIHNRRFPQEINEKLSSFVFHECQENSSLILYILQSQRNFRITSEQFNQLLSLWFHETQDKLIRNFASCLPSFIYEGLEFNQGLYQKCFLQSIDLIEPIHVQAIINKLPEPLSEELAEKLVQFAEKVTEKSTFDLLNSKLQHPNLLSPEQKTKLDLIQCNFLDLEDSLVRLRNFLDEGIGLLDSNLQFLNSALLATPETQPERIFQILEIFRYTAENQSTAICFPKIARLLEQLKNQNIREACIQIVRNNAELEEPIPEDLILALEELLMDKIKKISQDAETCLRSIKEYQELPGRITAKMELSTLKLHANLKAATLSSNLKKLNSFLDKNLMASPNIINKLGTLLGTESSRILEIRGSLQSIFASLLINKQILDSHPQIGKLIEEAILGEAWSSTILQSYKELLIKGCLDGRRYSEIECRIRKILTGLDKIKDPKSRILSLECLIELNMKGIHSNQETMDIYEGGLKSENTRIAELSFKGVKVLKKLGVEPSQIYSEFYTQKFAILKGLDGGNTNLSLQSRSEIVKLILALDVFEELSSLNLLEEAKSLLLSNFLDQYEASLEEQEEFKSAWKNFVENRVNLLNELKSLKSISQLSYDSTTLPGLSNTIQYLSLMKIEDDFEKNFQDSSWVKSLREHVIKVQLDTKPGAEEIQTKNLIKLFYNFEFKLFSSLMKILNELTPLEDLIALTDFCQKYEITAEEIAQSIPGKPKEIIIQLSTDRLLQKLSFSFQQDKSHSYQRKKKVQIIQDILKSWEFEALQDLISEMLRQGPKRQSIWQFLEMMRDYQIDKSCSATINEIISGSESAEWIPKFNLMIVGRIFNDQGQILDSSEIIRLLQEMNAQNQPQLEGESLRNVLESVRLSNFRSSLLETEKMICNFLPKDIKIWAKEAKSLKDSLLEQVSMTEILAILKVAHALFTERQQELNDAQLISIFLSLSKDPAKGRIFQILTGEGKSTVISAVAVIYCLTGNKVDIVTSSPVLAERDSKEKARFYELFGLSVSDNGERNLQLGPKACYKKDIVYGAVASFQFDYLSDTYYMLKTLNGRKQEFILIDEADNNLIDDCSKIARLSNNIIGMDALQPLYKAIWARLSYLESMLETNLQIIGDKTYLIHGYLEMVESCLRLTYSDNSNTEYVIENLEEHITSGLELPIAAAEEIKDNVENFIKNDLKKYILDEVLNEEIKSNSDSIPSLTIRLPPHLKEFAKMQLGQWIENALLAKWYFSENYQYTIEDGCIKPVEFDTSGIILNSTTWMDGLHQFLQLKHMLKLNSESLTTNYVSNLTYFKSYGHNMIGFTGTLGSEAAKNFLRKVYNVDLVAIPPAREKQYFQLPTLLIDSHVSWIKEVSKSAIGEASKGRGVLVICESINCVLEIEKMLKHFDYPDSRVVSYTNNNKNDARIIKHLQPGRIILATNLAGRGTDIKTADIEKAGGMHVILTFLPSNLRVEEQAFGRTSRNGNKGTSRLIICLESLAGLGIAHSSDIQKAWLEIESTNLKNFEQNQIPNIEFQGDIFKEFCQKLNLFKTEYQNKEKYETVYLSKYNAIEERWGFFLKNLERSELLIEHKRNEFKVFCQKLEVDIQQNTIIQNPFHEINIGFDILLNKKVGRSQALRDGLLKKERVKESLEYFNKAIARAPECVVAAYVGKAGALIELEEKNYKEDTQKLLLKALEIITSEVLIEQISNPKAFIISDFSLQSNEKFRYLSNYKKSIENALDIIHKIDRTVEVQSCDYDGIILKGIRNQDFTGIEGEYFPESESNRSKYTIYFDHLIDKGDHGGDQAINTIHSSGKEKNLAIKIEEMSSEVINSLINPNVKLHEVPRSSAINYLKQEVSVFHQITRGYATLYNKCFVDVTEIREGFADVTCARLEVAEALSMIENNRNERTLYNIVLHDINKVAKHFRKTIKKHSNLRFGLNLHDLSRDCVESLRSALPEHQPKTSLTVMADRSVPISLKDFLTRIFSILQELNMTNRIRLFKSTKLDEGYPELCKEEPLTIESPEWNDNYKEYELKIEILDLSFTHVFDILQKEEHSSFLLNIPELDFENFEKCMGLHKENVTLTITNLEISSCVDMIKILRKKDCEFALGFHSISRNEISRIYKAADLKQESIKIANWVSLRNQDFANNEKESPITEYAARGMDCIMEINERKFVPWTKIACVAGLGIAQLAAGAFLIQTPFGLTLITEGVTDLLLAGKGVYSREFNWSSYAKQKALGLTISLAAFGMASYFQRANLLTANAVRNTGERLAVKGIPTCIIAQKSALLETIKVSSRLMVSVGSQKKMLSNEITSKTPNQLDLKSEGLHHRLNSLKNLDLHLELKPDIKDRMLPILEDRFKHPDIIASIRTLKFVDKVTESDLFTKKIEKIVMTCSSSHHVSLEKHWNSIGASLIKPILSLPSKNFPSGLELLIRVSLTLFGLEEFMRVLDEIFMRIQQRLKDLVNSYNYADLIQKLSKIPEYEKNLKEHTYLKESGTITEDNTISLPACEKILINQEGVDETSLAFRLSKKFCKSSEDIHFIKYIVSEMAEAISRKIIEIFDSKMAEQWTSLAASHMAKKSSRYSETKHIISHSPNKTLKEEKIARNIEKTLEGESKEKKNESKMKKNSSQEFSEAGNPCLRIIKLESPSYRIASDESPTKDDVTKAASQRWRIDDDIEMIVEN